MKKKWILWLLVFLALCAAFIIWCEMREAEAKLLCNQEDEKIVLEIVVRDGREQADIKAGIGEPWTIEEIAQSVGMTTEGLMAMNRLDDKNIYPGQILRVEPYSDFNEIWVSWYGEETQGLMANGEIFNFEEESICAHRWLPFGTRVQLTYLETGKSIEVVVCDRGPYTDMEKRHFDISEAAAKKLGIYYVGVAKCQVKVLLPEG
jgi:rare lipoprotein A